MRGLDHSIEKFFTGIEDFYKNKFAALQKEIKLCARKGENHKNNNNLSRSQTLSKISSQDSYNASSLQLSPHRKMSQSNLAAQKSKEVPHNMNVHNKNILLLNSTHEKNYQSVETNRSRNNNNGLLANSLIIERPKKGLIVDLDYPKHINSKSIQNATVLNHLLGRKVKQYKLIYRGSENSFLVEDFYRKMANNYYNRNNEEITTMILVKTKYGRVLGGCTRLRWTREFISH